MIRTVIIGAGGSMGRHLLNLTLTDPELELAGAVDATGQACIGMDAGIHAGHTACGCLITDSLAQALSGADAVIDFSAAHAALANTRLAIAAGCSFVLGTTAVPEPDRKEILALGQNDGRIVFAPNMSIGMNLLFDLCSKLPKILGDAYDIEVVEMHHNRKKDAPSGTAVRLGEILAQSAGLNFATETCYGREGMTGARPKREIGIHAVRGGDVVGDHTVIFAAEGERVELTHKASSREAFAKGAIRAVKFLNNAAPGVYDMQDVLGLR